MQVQRRRQGGNGRGRLRALPGAVSRADVWTLRRLRRLLSLLLEPDSEQAWYWRIEVRILTFLLARYDDDEDAPAFPAPSPAHSVAATAASPVREASPPPPRTALGTLPRPRIAELLREIARANHGYAAA